MRDQKGEEKGGRADLLIHSALIHSLSPGLWSQCCDLRRTTATKAAMVLPSRTSIWSRAGPRPGKGW